MEKLSIQNIITSAQDFCNQESDIYRTELFGVTDGKAVGTYIEHLFRDYLSGKYDMTVGSSANGLDLPSINTDIKVTSIKQPQSSCPYSDSKQKIYGLGYNLIVFVYEKHDDNAQRKGKLKFVSCTFIESKRTGDFQMTTGLREIINNSGNEDDIFAYLTDHKLPGDEVTIMNIARDILNSPPEIGYLTISNALQWRLQYKRIVDLKESIEGITSIIKYEQ
ncbi:MAG: restriction endonuclease [Bacteroidaceae bacterium]|nr:restriction endonuclease [Bacteroidaceae bacterium]